MIRITLIGLLGLMVSCHTPKKVEEEQSKTAQTTADKNAGYYLGVVQILDCGVTIQITSGETKSTLSPTNLDPKFQVDNTRLKLKFKQLDERATGCMEFIAIEILDATVVN